MKKKDIVRIVSDILILLGLFMATNLLTGYLIPYINRTYKLTTEGSGTSDMMAYLFSGAKWFTTSLQGYELPEHKWYIVLAIAGMTQCIVSEMQSFLGFGSIDFGGKGQNFVVNKAVSSLVVSPVVTAFMLQLTICFILTICPQDIPLLFLAGEVIFFCLPALIHKYVIRREFSLQGFLFGAAEIALLYLVAKTESKVLAWVIFALVIGNELLHSSPSGEAAESSFILPGIIPAALYGGWIILGITLICPVVYTHMPTVEKNVEAVYCADIMVGEGTPRYIRTDGCLVDGSNNVRFEHVKQYLYCNHNAFYLTQDGVLQIYGGEGTLPTTVMEQVAWIAGYKDAMIILGENGSIYGFGDFGNYLAGEPCLEEITLLYEGYSFVQGDVGKEHILLLDENGDVYSFGCNSTGELGTGSRSLAPQPLQYVMSGAAKILAGIGTSYALTTEGTLYAWGRNDLGQLGTGIHIPSYKVGKGYAVNDDLTYAATPQEVSLKGAKLTDIAAGVIGAFALDEDGNVWAWGSGVTFESITKPKIICDGIRKIAGSKYRSGVSDQYLYMITKDDIAVRKRSSEYTSFEKSSVEIIFDTSAWMPEPIEVISSRLEDYLDALNLRKEEAPEPETEPAPDPVPTEFVLATARRHDVCWYWEFEGHTYRVFDECINFGNAKTHCETMGGHLVTITSQEELDFVCSMLEARKNVLNDTTTFHMGLTYDGNRYYWITGESTAFIDAVHINQANTTDYGEGVLRSDGRMNAGVIIPMPYICEWETYPLN